MTGRFLRARMGIFVVFTLTSAPMLWADLYDGSSPYAEVEFEPADYVLGPAAPTQSSYGNGKWGSGGYGTGATVTWSIMGGGLTIPTPYESTSKTTVALSSFMPAGYLNEIRSAFAAWSAVANITFVEMADSGAAGGALGATAEIRIGAHTFDGPAGTLAHGNYPKFVGTSIGGDIHFDSGDTWKIGFGGGGYDVFQVAAHEIGHAIGLAHSLVSSALMFNSYTEAFHGLQADDIAGAQYIYGLPVESVPEASTWFAGLALAFGGLSLWRSRRR